MIIMINMWTEDGNDGEPDALTKLELETKVGTATYGEKLTGIEYLQMVLELFKRYSIRPP